MKNLLELAVELAKSGPDRKFRLGCVALCDDGTIVGATNGPVFLSHSASEPIRHPSAHAEARTLRKAGYGATLCVVRLVTSGMTMAKPCGHCQAMIRSYGTKKVIYSLNADEYDIWYPGKSKTPNEYKKITYRNSTVWV